MHTTVFYRRRLGCCESHSYCWCVPSTIFCRRRLGCCHVPTTKFCRRCLGRNHRISWSELRQERLPMILNWIRGAFSTFHLGATFLGSARVSMGDMIAREGQPSSVCFGIWTWPQLNAAALGRARSWAAKGRARSWAVSRSPTRAASKGVGKKTISTILSGAKVTGSAR